jgi:hypothetical protein
VLLLESSRRLAAVGQIKIPQVGEPPPTIRLSACGTATVRLLDAAGQPVAGQQPGVWFWLGDDRPDNPATGTTSAWSTPLDASWVDLENYLAGPVTNSEGIATLPALIPGLQYTVSFTRSVGRPVSSAPFRVTPGQTLHLPDLAFTAESKDGSQPVPKDHKPDAVKAVTDAESGPGQ